MLLNLSELRRLVGHLMWRRVIWLVCFLPCLAVLFLLPVIAPFVWAVNGKNLHQLLQVYADLGERFYDWAVQRPGAWANVQAKHDQDT